MIDYLFVVFLFVCSCFISPFLCFLLCVLGGWLFGSFFLLFFFFFFGFFVCFLGFFLGGGGVIVLLLLFFWGDVVVATSKMGKTSSEKILKGARYSFVVERPLIVRCVVGSILNAGPSELFLIPASVPRLV